MIEQITEEEAVRIYTSGEWKNWTDEQIAEKQLYQRRLCVPFDKFHAAMEKVLGRPIWTHEFANSSALIAEYEHR